MRRIDDWDLGAKDIQRALTWVIFLAGASAVGYLCLSILRPFAGVIAWSCRSRDDLLPDTAALGTNDAVVRSSSSLPPMAAAWGSVRTSGALSRHLRSRGLTISVPLRQLAYSRAPPVRDNLAT